MADVTITVCTTCRRGQPTDTEGPRPGTLMLAALEQQDLPEGVTIRAVECMSACDNGCTIALTGGPARWSYVYQGNAQVLDHVLVSPGVLAGTRVDFRIVHLNAAWVDGASDHEPLVLTLQPR